MKTEQALSEKKQENQHLLIPTGLNAENLKKYQHLIKIGTKIHKEPSVILLNPGDPFFKAINAKLPPEYGYFRLSVAKSAITLVYRSHYNIITEKVINLIQHPHGIQVGYSHIFITSTNHTKFGFNLYLNLNIKEKARGQTVLEDIAGHNNVFLLYNFAPSNHLLDEEFPLTEEQKKFLTKFFNKTATQDKKNYVWPLASFTKNLLVPLYFHGLKHLKSIDFISNELFFLNLQSEAKDTSSSKSKSSVLTQYFILSTRQIKDMVLNSSTLEEKTRRMFLHYGFFKPDETLATANWKKSKRHFLRMLANRLPREIKQHILSFVYETDYLKLSGTINETTLLTHLISSKDFKSAIYLLTKSEDLRKSYKIDKSNLNEFDSNGSTLLHYAAMSGNVNVINLLIIQGAQPEHLNKNGCTALHLAVSNELHNKSLLQSLAGKNNCLIDLLDNQKHSALFYAGLNKNLKAIESLLQLGATANISDINIFDTINNIKNYTNLYNVLKTINEANVEMNSQVLKECIESIESKDFPKEQKQALVELLSESPLPCHTM